MAQNTLSRTASKPGFLPLVALAILVAYNMVYFLGKFASHLAPSLLNPSYAAIKESVGFFTILEILGVAGVFIDLVVRFDEIGERSRTGRNLRLLFTAFVFITFVFKVFMNFVDSAYLAPDN